MKAEISNEILVTSAKDVVVQLKPENIENMRLASKGNKLTMEVVLKENFATDFMVETGMEMNVEI